MSDYRGKVVVLTLWASWCGPCREAINGLVELEDEFARRGVQVIALSMEDPRKSYADVRRFVEGFPSDYRVGWISAISADRLMAEKALLPQIFVIRNGLVLRTFLGWHRKGFRLLWRWKSRPRGRPRVPADLQELIFKMAQENPTWGEERIAALSCCSSWAFEYPLGQSDATFP